MDFNKNGIVISVSDDVVEELILERLRGYDKPSQAINNVVTADAVLPRIGARIGADVPELGGVFAGVMRGRADLFEGRDYYLIVGPEAPKKLKWKAAKDWAADVQQHGFKDFTLEYRKEQALEFANVPELFQTDEWYWSQEQRAANSDYAWAQTFNDGGQNDCLKGGDFRARAVRRIPIR